MEKDVIRHRKCSASKSTVLLNRGTRPHLALRGAVQGCGLQGRGGRALPLCRGDGGQARAVYCACVEELSGLMGTDGRGRPPRLARPRARQR